MKTSSVCNFLSAMMMAGTHIDCCISISAQVEILPNVNKTADAQSDYRVMTWGIEIGVGWTKKGETFDNQMCALPMLFPSSAQRNSCPSWVPIASKRMKISILCAAFPVSDASVRTLSRGIYVNRIGLAFQSAADRTVSLKICRFGPQVEVRQSQHRVPILIIVSKTL